VKAKLLALLFGKMFCVIILMKILITNIIKERVEIRILMHIQGGKTNMLNMSESHKMG